MSEPQNVIVPARLTAENGAKAELIGEFHIDVQFPNEKCGCGVEDCQFCLVEDGSTIEKVSVDWTTIKKIYATAVDFFVNNHGVGIETVDPEINRPGSRIMDLIDQRGICQTVRGVFVPGCLGAVSACGCGKTLPEIKTFCTCPNQPEALDSNG